MPPTPAIRDRILELRRVPASELIPNKRNWRRHPDKQRRVLAGMLEEVGYANALIARELDDGSLELIDGHLRAETTPDQEVPVLVLDVTEEEANMLLASLDPIAAMAETGREALEALMSSFTPQTEGARELVSFMAKGGGNGLPSSASDRAWRVNAGEIWELGPHHLACADATTFDDVVERLGAIDHIGPVVFSATVFSDHEAAEDKVRAFCDQLVGSMAAAERVGRSLTLLDVDVAICEALLGRWEATTGILPELVKAPAGAR